MQKVKFVFRDVNGEEMYSNTEFVDASQAGTPLVDMCLHYPLPPRISSYGTYWFSIEKDGEELAKTPLHVSRKAAPLR
jgi:hypothetical protein